MILLKSFLNWAEHLGVGSGCPVHGERKISGISTVSVSAVSRKPSAVSNIPRRQSTAIQRKSSSVSTMSRQSVRSIKSNGSSRSAKQEI